MKKGFTLIELLVVIAIIAILAGIMFPVFSSAREKARQTSCMSNLKQIGTAVMLYADDYHETYPMARIEYNKDTWMLSIYPYVKNQQVYFCPSSYSDLDGGEDETVNLAPKGAGAKANYSANLYMLGDKLNASFAKAKKIARIKSPSNTVMLLEGSTYMMPDDWWDYAEGGYWLSGAGLGTGSKLSQTESVLTGEDLRDYKDGRHSQGMILCYADGHAEYEKCSIVFSWKGLDKKNPMRPATW